jgi:formylglycine-generating enzyme required for sulfatase activity
MKPCTGVLIFCIMLVAHAELASAETRIALVIGNGAYTASPLRNPPNDVKLIAKILANLGFDVTERTNVDQKTMKTLIRDFGDRIKARKDATGVFYYSGHGMQVDGRNYMIPVPGETIRDEGDVKIEGVGVDEVLTRMEFAGNAASFVFLDACRDNPFQKSFKSAASGLARMDPPTGSLIAFAAEPNKRALEGPGNYSYFTEALAQEIVKPDVPITDVLINVRKTVVNRTARKQVPVDESQLLEKFYFNSKPGVSQAAPEIFPKTLAMAPRPLWEAAATTWKEPFTGMEFVLVPGGCYEMGDAFGDGYDDQKPAHKVCLDDYYMAKYEVTQKQWQMVMGGNPSNFKGCDDCPVENVSWDDAQAFIKKVNDRTGMRLRLPTEAEWEYACAARSGGKKEKWAGTDNESSLGEYAWYDKNSEKRTRPVGQKKPNGLGLYDMSGNVQEWVNDWYDDKYYGKSPEKNPQGPLEGALTLFGKGRVIRGGSWDYDLDYARCADRGWTYPDNGVYYFGFRCARTP